MVMCGGAHHTYALGPRRGLSGPLCIVSSRLFRERLNQMKVKLDEVLAGKAGEYQDPLVVLQQNMQMRTQVAGNGTAHNCSS